MRATFEFTAREIAEALGVVKMTILRRAEKEGWPYENGTNRARRYRLEKLPAEIQKALVSKMDVPVHMLPALAPTAVLEAAKRMVPEDPTCLGTATTMPSWTDEAGISVDTLHNPRVAQLIKIVQEAQEAPRGVKKRKWIETVAAKYGSSYRTVYRYLKKYEKQGLSGLVHVKSSRNNPKAWTPEALDYWIGLCLKQEHRKIAKDVLYTILTKEARKRDWKIGSYRSACWWFQEKASPQLLAFQRGGNRALDNTLPPVLRNYSDLKPFEILVGDQHRFDFWVVDEETGEVFRPEGYFWQDLRTRCFYGGALDRKYDSYLMGLALRMGLKIFGPFSQIYTDHGKPEESRYILGILKDMHALGLEVGKTMDAPVDLSGANPEEINPRVLMPGTHRQAIVRNAKAKMIEKTFNDLEGILRDHFMVSGYVKTLGHGQEENDTDTAEVDRLAKAGKLMTYREFFLTVLKAMDYYNREKAHRGVVREWAWRPKPKSATPMDCLKACYADGWRKVQLSDDTIDLVFLARATKPRVVDRGRILFRKEIYENEGLIGLHKQPVHIRFDPIDPEWILVFHDGRFVCQAEPVTYSSMKDMTIAQHKIEEKRRRRRGFILEYRRYTANVPDFRPHSQVPASEKAAVLWGKAKVKKQKALSEHYRDRTPEELDREIAQIDNYRPQHTVNRPIFNTEVDRYEWTLRMISEGAALEEEDHRFMREFEANMDPDTKTYWDIYKETLEGGVIQETI